MNPSVRSHHQRYLGIIGRHISHTLSPVMYTVAFKKMNLDLVYGVIDVQDDMLPNAVSAMRMLNFRGANVTIPHKKAVIELVDKVSDEAKVIGAVNTIVNENGTLTGYNTDVHGIVFSLQQYETEIKNSSVVIFGAGGATRATVYALATHFKPAKITIVNRTFDNAAALVELFRNHFPTVNFFVTNDDQQVSEEIKNATLIINTTSLGMKPHVHLHPIPSQAVIHQKHIVFDIVYNPLNTSLLTMAHSKGARIIGGIEMLLGQGEKAFELFTSQHFPIETARTALHKELR